MIEAGGQLLVGPDNGLFTRTVKTLGEPVRIRRLTEARYWRPTVSSTFHGRDVFAPVAAFLTLGTDPALMGPVVAEMVELKSCSAVCWGNRRAGEVQFVDEFGNLITNIPAAHLKSHSVRATVGGADPVPVRWCADVLRRRTGGVGVARLQRRLRRVRGGQRQRRAAGSGAEVGTPVELHLG